MNMLAYTLGLDASPFVRGTEAAARGLGSLTGSFAKLTGVGALIGGAFAGLKAGFNIVEGVEAAIQKGAHLSDLSKQTGESVENLYKLQKGISAVGGDSESTAGMVFQLRRALGGVNEEGLPTGKIFSQLGLSIDDLKSMDAPTALTAIARSMKNMDTSTAASAAGKIFGRNGAQSFLLMARSGEEMAQAMERAGKEAAIFGRNAERFEKIDKTIGQIKDKTNGLFASLAEGLAPGIQAGLDQLNNIDLTGLGQRIGDAFAVITEAIKEGKIYDFLTGAFSAAAEFGGNVIFGVLGNGSFWGGIWNEAIGEFVIKFSSVAKVFLGLGTVLKSALIKAYEEWFAVLAKTPGIGKILGIDHFQSRSFKQIFSEEKRNAGPAQDMVTGWLNSGFERYQSGWTGIANALKTAIANSGGAEQEKFKALYNSLLTNSKAGFKNDEEKAKKGTNQLAVGGDYKPEHTALEKMGFVFGGTAGSDHAATTARNTGNTVAELRKMVNLMRNIPFFGSAFAQVNTNSFY